MCTATNLSFDACLQLPFEAPTARSPALQEATNLLAHAPRTRMYAIAEASAVHSIFNAFFQLAGCIVFIILLPTAAPKTQSAHYVFKGWSYNDSGLPNNVYGPVVATISCRHLAEHISAASEVSGQPCECVLRVQQSAHYVFNGLLYDDSGLPSNVYGPVAAAISCMHLDGMASSCAYWNLLISTQSRAQPSHKVVYWQKQSSSFKSQLHVVLSDLQCNVCRYIFLVGLLYTQFTINGAAALLPKRCCCCCCSSMQSRLQPHAPCFFQQPSALLTVPVLSRACECSDSCTSQMHTVDVSHIAP